MEHFLHNCHSSKCILTTYFNPYNNNMRWLLSYSLVYTWKKIQRSQVCWEPPVRVRRDICSQKPRLQNPCILNHCRLLPFIIIYCSSFTWFISIYTLDLLNFLVCKVNSPIFQPQFKHICIYHAPKDSSCYHHIITIF